MAAAIINVRLVNVLISNQCHLRSKYQNWNGQKMLGVPDFGPKTAYNRGPRIIEARIIRGLTVQRNSTLSNPTVGGQFLLPTLNYNKIINMAIHKKNLQFTM